MVLSVPILATDKLCHEYENGVRAVEGVTVRIESGECLGLIGQNGSGKTTLAKHLMGLLRPTSGQVLLKGKDISAMTVAQIARYVGFVFHNPDHQIFCSTVWEELAFGLRMMKLPKKECRDRVQETLTRFSLEQFSAHPPAVLGFGLRRKVSLAAIYAMKPEVLILDEPTVGLDRKSSLELMKIVMELNGSGHTVVIITHDMRMIAEYTRTVIVLKQGRLLTEGSTAEVLSHPEILLKTQIKPPQVVELARAMNMQYPSGLLPLTNDSFLDLYEARRKT